MSRNENEINALLDTILKRNDVNLMSDERCNALNTFVERIKEGISLNFPRILALVNSLWNICFVIEMIIRVIFDIDRYFVNSDTDCWG